MNQADSSTRAVPQAGILLRSAFSLLMRQGMIQIIGAVTGITLARMLLPASFGVYAICTFLFAALSSLGDLGYGAALIRSSGSPGQNELKTCLCIRQVLDLCVCSIAFIFAPALAQLYGGGIELVWTFRLIAIAALLSSMSVVPTILLERKLAYSRIAGVEIAQAFVYSVLCVLLVYCDFGILSFGIAWLGFSLTSALGLSLLQPWQFGWRFQRAGLRENLRFGIPYQGTGIVVLMRDSFAPIAIGGFLGTAAVGLCNWAQMIALFAAAGTPILQRLCLAALSASVGNKEALAEQTSQLLFIANGLVAPCAAILLVCIEPGTRLVFGPQWYEGIPLFYAFWLANLSLPSMAICLGYFTATGRSRFSFLATLLISAGLWSLALPLIWSMGAMGYAIGYALVHLSGLVLLWRVRREVPIQLIRPILLPWSLALLCAAPISLLQIQYPQLSLFVLAIAASLAGSAYCVLTAVAMGFFQTSLRPVLQFLRVAENS